MNSTNKIGATSSDHPLEDWLASSTSANLHLLFTSFLNRYRPELDILWVLLTYSPFLVPTYSYLSAEKTRANNFPHPAMLGHILVAPLYVLRWHARYAATRVWPRPELFDLVLFTTFWVSSTSLEFSRVRKGLPVPLFRAGFQVAIAMHGACFAAAWWAPGGRDAALFRATVKFFNWFASFRGTLTLIGRVDPPLMKSPAAWTSLVMMTSASYAWWEAGLPDAAPVFMVLTGTLALIKQALTERIAS